MQSLECFGFGARGLGLLKSQGLGLGLWITIAQTRSHSLGHKIIHQVAVSLCRRDYVYVAYPKGPCTHIVYTFGLKVLPL